MSSHIQAHEHVCDSVGMLRRVLVDSSEKPFRLNNQLWSQSNGMKAGQIWRVRVKAKDPGLKGCFVDAGNGIQAYLQVKKNGPPEGSIVEVVVKSEQRAEKKAVVVLDNSAARLFPDIQTGKLSEPSKDPFYSGVDIVASSSNRESKLIVSETFEQALSDSIPINGGGMVHFEQTRALLAIDIDAGGRMSRGDRSRFALNTNIEACDTIARQIALTSSGGLAVIDFLKMSKAEDNRKIEMHLKDKLALYLGRQSQIGKISPLGLLEVSMAHIQTPIASLWKGISFEEQSALRLLNELETVGMSETGKILKVRLSKKLLKWLDYGPFDWRLALADRIGPRFKFHTVENVDQTWFEIRSE